MVFFDFPPVGVGGLLDFQGMDHAVLLYNHVDLLGVGVPVVGQVRFLRGVGKALQQLHHHMVFEVVSAGSPLHQGVSGEPHGQVGAQARVAEIQLGGLGQALQLVVGKGRQQVDNAQALENPHPLLCRGLGDLRGLGQRPVVNLLGRQGGAGVEKLSEPHHIGDPAFLRHVPHQISLNVGVEILLTLLRVCPQCVGHPATPNVLEHVHDVVLLGGSLPLQQTGQGEVHLVGEHRAVHFLLGQAVELQNPNAARQGLSDVFHHPVLLGAGEPEQPPLLAFIAHDFDLLKQLRGLLNLVDDDRRLVGLEEQHRVRLGQGPGHGVVHGHIGAVLPLRQVFQHGGLAHLTGTRHQHRLEKGTHVQKLSLQCPFHVCHTRTSLF